MADRRLLVPGLVLAAVAGFLLGACGGGGGGAVGTDSVGATRVGRAWVRAGTLGRVAVTPGARLRARLDELADALEADRALRLSSPPPTPEQTSYSTALIRQQAQQLQGLLRPPPPTGPEA
jgi:hypothetical protein